MAAKGTSIKEAIARWETKHEKKVSDETVVKLYMQCPPIEKMDSALSQLAHVEMLSLSTNCIDKIANLNGFKNLRVLSLARNNLKSLSGLEGVRDTLEELWVSYNLLEKLKGVGELSNVKILHLTNNKVKDWKEFGQIEKMASLVELTFTGNPLHESAGADFHDQVANKLTKLKKLDGIPIVREDEDDD
eukprot:m.122098 g.122098  ORF g.122098 m.122098 type:complete len:189 (+) comp16548_c0_seq2:66-632(+)